MTLLLPLDWAGLWRSQVAAEHAQYDLLCPAELRPGADWWAAHARRFHERTRRDPDPTPLLPLLQELVRPGMRVLDVGAGTGRYAIPLAQAGARVTAVEPSAGMRGYLETAIEGQQLDIQVVPATWEQAEVEPAELVICVHVLYPIADAEPFLRKLNAHTLERCVVVLGYRPPSAWLNPLWKTVYGVERLALPGAIEALALLQQLGIEAQLQLLPLAYGLRFASLEDALQEVHARLCLRPDAERDRQLLELLGSYLRPHPLDGFQPPQPAHVPLIWWQRSDDKR